MIQVFYTPSFVRQYKKLSPSLRQEVKEKIEEFKQKKNHPKLKVHKLHGELRTFYGFSVNYKIHVVFFWADKNKKTVWLEAVGSHDVYR